MSEELDYRKLLAELRTHTPPSPADIEEMGYLVDIIETIERTKALDRGDIAEFVRLHKQMRRRPLWEQ